MKPLVGLLMVSWCFALPGCSRGPGKLDGDVFIVTEGAQNVNFGLVEVRVLPYEETKGSIAKTKIQAQQEIAKLQPQVVAAQKALELAQARCRDSFTRTTAIIEGDFDPDSPRYRADVRAQNSACDILNNSWAALGNLKDQVRGWNSRLRILRICRLLWRRPKRMRMVVTIPLDRKATVALAAYATRRVFDETEDYYWLVRVSLNGQPSKRIFLSNDNLATSIPRIRWCMSWNEPADTYGARTERPDVAWVVVGNGPYGVHQMPGKPELP